MPSGGGIHAITKFDHSPRDVLKRYIAREIFRHLRPRRLTDGEPQAFVEPATAGRAENRLARRGQRTMTSLPA
jgi:hypothetical protein